MRVAVLADIHLDAQFAQFAPDVARKRRRAIRDALQAALERSAAEGVDAILVAGDLYEHDRVSVSPETQSFLRTSFAEVAPIPVFVAPGNHDWLGPRSLYEIIDWSDNVRIFRNARLEPVELQPGVTLWGAAHLAPAGTACFLTGFRTGRGGVNIALFHGAERGGLPFEESGKALHAPFDEAEIEAAGLAHAFVGHYHHPRDGRLHTYPGNPEPLTFGEDGSRGLVIAEISADGTVSRDRIVVSRTRVFDRRVDISGCATSTEVMERVRAAFAGLSGIARASLHGELDGRTDLRLDDVRHACDWLDELVVRAEGLHVAYDIDAIRTEATVRGQFVRDVLAAPLDDDDKNRVIVTGLRAFDGRDDLEVVL